MGQVPFQDPARSRDTVQNISCWQGYGCEHTYLLVECGRVDNHCKLGQCCSQR
jgi:hypothetical protein